MQSPWRGKARGEWTSRGAGAAPPPSSRRARSARHRSAWSEGAWPAWDPPGRATGRIATPNQGRPRVPVTRSRLPKNVVPVCGRAEVGTPRPWRPTCRFRRHPSRRSRRPTRCRRPIPFRPTSRTRFRRRSSDRVVRRRATHGRAGCHVQVYSAAASGRQSNSRVAQTGHMIAMLVGSTPSGSSPENAAQDRPSSSLTHPHSSQRSTAGC